MTTFLWVRGDAGTWHYATEKNTAYGTRHWYSVCRNRQVYGSFGVEKALSLSPLDKVCKRCATLYTTKA